ncbi:hypothetical protein FB566_3429 [Stackebrandtia endophytica]|uniref:NAD(P)-binding domain-containing protein n=1 Tax=Stackebrandtia endophytica TaxID=1496996 RepID=A0A543AZ49_9ACTN|nr:NAD(P)H-binding protein [Stackebrandtia endophytica]TQL77861.1 hypothetical protein FB566_3429 [Stackebrandtia endophytica]
MRRALVLGATGRAGSAVVAELSTHTRVVAAMRVPTDVERLPATTAPFETVIVDLDDPVGIAAAAQDVDVVVNAIRLREDIPPTALIELHESIREMSPADAHIVTVGGAGSLHLPDGRRFWQHPAFPARTLPRGIAHSRLRDHLESDRGGTRWSYLIPPPAFDPDGPREGRFHAARPAGDESRFAQTGAIGYADFAVATAHHVITGQSGTRLIDEALRKVS